MADRYWVGGTGTWDGTSTANWSASSGGASGASVPTAADNVFFDAGSDAGGIFTVTMATTPRLCNDFTASGLDFTMTLAGTSIGLTVSGSLTFPATNFTRTYTGITTFNATTTGKTITTNGVAFGANVTLNGVGGAWTLGSAFSCGTSTLSLTNGTFDTSASNYAVTAGLFSSSNSNIRTINLNGSTITLSGSSFGWTMTTSTNATVNAGTSTIQLSDSSAPVFNGGGLTYYNVSFTNTAATSGSRSITGANTFNNLTFSTIASAGTNGIRILADQIINGTLTASGSSGNRRMYFNSGTSPPIGTTRTLTCASIAAMSDVDFRDITIAGAHGTLSGTRLGDCGGNSNITFVAGKTVYWNLAVGGNWNTNGWAASSGGAVATTNYPLPQDIAVIENTGLNTSATISVGTEANIGTFDASTRTNAMTFNISAFSPRIYGDFLLGSSSIVITAISTGILYFNNRSIKTVNSGGSTFNVEVHVDSPGGGIQLITNNLTVSSTQEVFLRTGTLDLNNLTLTTPKFSSSFSDTRAVAFGATGSIILNNTTAGADNLDIATATGFTFTGTSNISAAMSVTRTFRFGTTGATASNRLNINLTSGSSTPTFSGSFRQIDFTGSTASASATCHGFTLASGGTYTGNNFTTVGDGTLTSNGRAINVLTVNGAGITTTLQDALTTLTGSGSATCTLTQGTLNLNNFTLTTSILSSSNTNTRAIAFGSTGSIVLAASVGATNLSMATATNFTFTGTSSISAAMSVTRTFNFGGTAGATTSNRLNINLTSGASIPTFTGSFRQINFTGSTSNPGNQNISCHGFTLASGGTYTTTDFTTVGDGTLTYTGKAFDALLINGSGITTTLADAGQNAQLSLINGTLDLAGFTFTATSAVVTFTGTKNLTFNGGTVVCSAATSTAWYNNVPTGFTTTAGTGTGTISMTAATAKTFDGGGSTYNCTLNQGGAGTLTITGANTFNDITETVPTANQITFPASTTTTVNNFTLSGSSGNLVSIRSSTPATQFTLSKSSGTVSVSYLDIQDSNATGGATWQSFTSNGNVNSGNNLGWDFGGVTYNVSITESITASDSVLLRLTRFGAVLESATVSDSAASQLTANGAISESATVSDSAASQLTANGAISESATVSDSAASQLTANGAISESSTVSDSAASQLTALGLVSEQATISDTPENILVRSGAVLEQATQSDSAASQLTAVASVSEQATQSDSASSQLTANGSISETATQSDSAVSQLTAVGLVSESVTVSDSTNSQITFVTNIIEQISFSDTTSAILIRFGDIAEQSTVADSAASQITATTLISETAALSDAAQALMVFFCEILEGSQSIPESTFTLPTGTSFTGSTYFNNTSAGGGLTVVANGTGTGSSGGFNAGGNYVLFSGANTRSIRTKALDLRLCNNFSFSIIRGTNTNGGEVPDTGENIVVEYSINGGGSYTTIATILNTAAITTFTTLSYSTPVGAQTSSTIIRWRQVTSSAGVFDNYGIRTFTFDGQNATLMSDVAASQFITGVAVSEQSALTDTPAARLIRQGLITELATMSETSASQLTAVALVSEQSTAAEATAASLLRNGLISEQSAISDESAARLVRQGLISEQASISEAVSSLIIYLTSILEQGQASVALTTQMTMVASILEQAQSADQAVSSFIVSGFINEALSAEDEASIRFLWELIEDNQVPNWQNASTNQTPGWGNVDTATTPNWQNISNDQSSGWGTINTAADGNWNNINTSPE